MKTLTSKGFTVLVQAGAGLGAQHKDSDYVKAGAKLIEGNAIDLYNQSDVVLKVRPPLMEKEVDLIKDNSVLVSLVYPAQNKVIECMIS